ncbi:hypothetical protein JTB14_003971 [Gonioctena quinquepunctata]|nr:hypothetical protein JTB14_003971 [Gonioctena quinquepunctata]
MQAVCDQEKMSKSELTLPTENPPVVLESEILSRKSTKYSEELSSTKGETKRSKQSSVSLEKRKQALEIEKRRQELEKESRRVQYELEEKKRQLEDDLKMLRMQEELQFAAEENTNESNSEDSREACSEISKHESVRKWDKNKENVDFNNESVPYVPGDLTEEHHQLPSHNELAVNRFTEDKSPRKGLPNIRDNFLQALPEPERNLTKEVEDFYKSHKEMLHAECPEKFRESKKDRILSPILAAISNFNLAKRLHKENLEHNPLADTVCDSMYKKMQMHRDCEPGLMLEDKHCATGVGWKGYPGYGPTRCTKLKIYRPKTTGHIKEDSISSFDKKWRFIRQCKVTPMDLAICWDLSPVDPKDEPHRPTHIDGSNGSAAPAVFNLVHTPKEEEVEQKCDGIHGCGPLFDHSNRGSEEKDYIFHRPKNKPRSINSNKSDASSKNKRTKSAFDADKKSVNSRESGSSSKFRAKSACNLNKSEHSHSSNETNNNYNFNKVNHSTPNLSEHEQCSEEQCNKKPNKVTGNKLCVACELKNMSIKEKRPKSKYKMAFKAGVPQKIVSRSSNKIKVPRQKAPYMVKTYVIDSLAPPFSLQKSKREDYPDHWRLATVYQHSYKPIHARKSPMLHTVFK